ncbi:hypothetical protein [Microbacterium sp. LMI1-1-1.1]|uniref:hypothetical protein n=1 Tax=Microbacterium sp. LMI1-1-1.1 TaxID=3135223 RepID=UPI003466DFCC
MTADPTPTGPNRPVRIAHLPPLRPRRRRPPVVDTSAPAVERPASDAAPRREAGAA